MNLRQLFYFVTLLVLPNIKSRLYSYVEAMLAAGTNNCVLTLFLREPQVVLAGGTFSVNVGFSVPVFTFLQIDELFRLIRKFDKFLVFLLSFVNIS